MVQTHFKIIQNEAKWNKCEKSPFFNCYMRFRPLDTLLVVLYALQVAHIGSPPVDRLPIGCKNPLTARPRARKACKSSKMGDFSRFFQFCLILINVKMCL